LPWVGTYAIGSAYLPQFFWILLFVFIRYARQKRMNLRDLIFSQQSLLEDTVEVNSEPGKDFLSHGQNDFCFLPHYDGTSPLTHKTEKSKFRDKARFSFDNNQYYANILQNSEAEEDNDDNLESERKTNSDYFFSQRVPIFNDRVPSRVNGGSCYELSPEFFLSANHRISATLKDETSSSRSVDKAPAYEYLPNELSYLRFSQLEGEGISCFTFQRKIIREIFLRCYYGNDVEGLFEILSLLVEKKEFSLSSDIAILLQILSLSSARISIVNKFALNLFSKQFNVSHKIPEGSPNVTSLLHRFLQVLLEESVVDEKNYGYALSGYGYLLGVKRLVSSAKEYPAMKSLAILWAIESVVICHQLIVKSHHLLHSCNENSQSFSDVLRMLSVSSVLKAPSLFARVVKIVFKAGYGSFSNSDSIESTSNINNHERDECRSLIREAIHCFRFTFNCEETKCWVGFHQLYLAFLAGINEYQKVRTGPFYACFGLSFGFV
jgi:hypothetical protein